MKNHRGVWIGTALVLFALFTTVFLLRQDRVSIEAVAVPKFAAKSTAIAKAVVPPQPTVVNQKASVATPPPVTVAAAPRVEPEVQAQPAWAIKYGNEFWRTAKPTDWNSVSLDPQAPRPEFSVADVVDRVSHVIKAGEKGHYVESRDYRADFVGHDLVFSPGRAGQDAAGEVPLAYRTVAIFAGGQAVYDNSRTVGESVAYGNTLQKQLADHLVEHYEARSEGVEVSWILQQPPAQPGSELLIFGQVDGVGKGEPVEGGLLFPSTEGDNRVRVGTAVAVDARGQRWELAMSSSQAGSVRIGVPAEVLASAQYPLAIDPLISVVGFVDPAGEYEFVFDQISNVDLAWSKVANTYLITCRWSRPPYGYFAIRISNGVILDPSGISFNALNANPCGEDQDDFFHIYGYPQATSLGADKFLVVNGTKWIGLLNASGSPSVTEKNLPCYDTSSFDKIKHVDVASMGTNALVLFSSQGGLYAFPLDEAGDVIGYPSYLTAAGGDARLAYFAYLQDHQIGEPNTTEKKYQFVGLASDGTNYLAAFNYTNRYNTGSVYLDAVWVSRTGTALSASTRVRSRTDGAFMDAPAVAWGTNSYLIAWREKLGSTYENYYAMAAAAPSAIASATSMDISSALSSPSVAWGTTSFLVTYHKSGSGGFRGALVSGDGALLSSFNVTVVNGPSYGTRTFFDGVHFKVLSGSQIKSINPDGSIPVGENEYWSLRKPQAVASATPAMAWDGTEYLLAFLLEASLDPLRNAYKNNVVGKRISVSGVDVNPGIPPQVISAGDNVYNDNIYYGGGNPLALAGANKFLVVWQAGHPDAAYAMDKEIRFAIVDTPGGSGLSVDASGTLDTAAFASGLSVRNIASASAQQQWLIQWIRDSYSYVSRVSESLLTRLDPLGGVQVGYAIKDGYGYWLTQAASDGNNFLVSRPQGSSLYSRIMDHNGVLGAQTIASGPTVNTYSRPNPTLLWSPVHNEYLAFVKRGSLLSQGVSNIAIRISSTGVVLGEQVLDPTIKAFPTAYDGNVFWAKNFEQDSLPTYNFGDEVSLFSTTLDYLGTLRSTGARNVPGAGTTSPTFESVTLPGGVNPDLVWAKSEADNQLEGRIHPIIYGVQYLPIPKWKSFPPLVAAEQLATFSGAHSFNQHPNRPIINYEWDFDFNTVFEKNGVSVTHTFATPGNYPVRMRVTDRDNGTLLQRAVTMVFTVKVSSVVVPMSAPVVDTQAGEISVDFTAAGGGQTYDVFSTTDPFAANPTWGSVQQNTADGNFTAPIPASSIQYYRVVKDGQPPDENGLFAVVKPTVQQGYMMMSSPVDGDRDFRDGGEYGAQLAAGLTGDNNGINGSGDLVILWEGGGWNRTLYLDANRKWRETAGGSLTTANPLSPGQGFLLNKRSAAPLQPVLVGAVGNTGEKTITLQPGFNVVSVSEGKPISIAEAFETAEPQGSYDFSQADEVYTQNANLTWNRLVRLPDDTWLDTRTGATANMTLQPGQAYYYKRQGVATQVEF